MTLDEKTVFKGEIAKACGGMLGGVDAFGDVNSQQTLPTVFLVNFLCRPFFLRLTK